MSCDELIPVSGAEYKSAPMKYEAVFFFPVQTTNQVYWRYFNERFR